MLPLPETIITLLVPFAPLFTRPVWGHAQVLLIGALLCRGPRTVTAVLRVMGLGGEKRFEKYHRVLSRARWSGLQGAKILLGLLVGLLPPDWPVWVGVDETIERRQGRKIKAKGRYRDAVRSTKKVVVKCYGLKWISMMLLVRLPWSSRVWGLPFLTVLAPSKQANEAAGRRHKTTVDWTLQMVKVVSRWLGERAWRLVGDGAYACVCLALAGVAEGSTMTLISRLRLDARLYDFPVNVPGRRGPKPQKGRKKRKALKDRIDDAKRRGKRVEIDWYGGERKLVCLLSGVCLWYVSGLPPVPIRWVLVVDPSGKSRPEAFFSTDRTMSPQQIVEGFVLRWNVEVTFEETRRHLGVETQRQWSDLAIARTTPVLLSLFSLVCLIAYHLTATIKLVPASTAWYLKTEATFSDVLALVRRAVWAEKYFDRSVIQGEHVIIRRDDWEVLMDQLASTA
jgi:hypothetical protein